LRGAAAITISVIVNVNMNQTYKTIMNLIHSANSSQAGRRYCRHSSRSSAMPSISPFVSKWLGLTLATNCSLRRAE
jgi:hypothetical protein